jgi:precorrin-6x reductase
MADAVFLRLVEEDDLVALGHAIVATDVAHIDAAIRKNQERRLRALGRARVPAFAAADHVANVRGRGVEQQFDRKRCHD